MKMRDLLSGAVALLCAAVIPACNPEIKPTGTSTVTIGGDGGESYDECIVQMASAGETRIAGLYATWLDLRFDKSSDRGDGVSLRTVLFHNTAELSAGRYTFPSTGAGSARGTFGGADFAGDIVSGSVEVAISGKTYTITMSDAVWDSGHGQSDSFGFRYSGRVLPTDNYDWVEAPLPEFYGASTMVETVSGMSFPHMNLTLHYFGTNNPVGSYCNMLQLKSKVGEVKVTIELYLYSDTRGPVAGAYTATVPDTEVSYENGRFGGVVMYEQGGNLTSRRIHGGTLVVSESGGVYTIVVSDVTGWSDWPETGRGDRLELDGTFTGFVYDFIDYAG